mmetsp:Transcript_25380/g.52497  ORF Transcript_25380/g.52497 Transcript_25380/m.52497 type:complete len:206 (+) Transcript_25380:169-786(+)
MLRTTSSAMLAFTRRLPTAVAPLPRGSLPSSSTLIVPSSPSPQSPLSTSRGMTILSKESAEEYKKENYTTRMAKTRRPVSPHVTIYSFPICAISSITTRVTGCVLSFGAAGVGLVEIFGGNGAALSLMQHIGSGGLGGVGFLGAGAIVAGAKFSVAFPFAYHYLGGLRHLVWDGKPEMLTNVEVEKASYALFGGSLLLGSLAAVL